MRTPLAWLNTIQNKKRTFSAVCGICFAVVLIFMQAGFLGAAKLNSSLVYRMLDYDFMVVSRGYLMMTRSESIDIYRVLQARTIPGVERVLGLVVSGGRWQLPEHSSSDSSFVFGIESGQPYFLDPELNTAGAQLRGRMSVMGDRFARDSYGDWDIGDDAIINHQTVSIVGEYSLGMGLLSDGSAIVSHDTFLRLFGQATLDAYQFGLVQLGANADADAVRRQLEADLPSDVMVLTRDELIEREENYFVNVKPVGIMFRVGMLVAFIVGAVILYQILASEIANRINEFATLKAIGYAENYLYRLGIKQGLLFAAMGFLPAWILSYGLYAVLRDLVSFPIFMTPGRTLFVLGLTLGMCAIAAVFALGKIKRADPADLF
jgi:putative ABC transport system permease protein